jgi:hypothetical protein
MFVAERKIETPPIIMPAMPTIIASKRKFFCLFMDWFLLALI